MFSIVCGRKSSYFVSLPVCNSKTLAWVFLAWTCLTFWLVLFWLLSYWAIFADPQIFLIRALSFCKTILFRPGFTRISLPFFIPDAEADFILDAIKFVASHGWAFLPLYRYNPSTAEWVHRQHDPSRDRKWLGNVNYLSGKMTWSSTRLRTEMPAPRDFEVRVHGLWVVLCSHQKSKISPSSKTANFCPF